MNPQQPQMYPSPYVPPPGAPVGQYSAMPYPPPPGDVGQYPAAQQWQPQQQGYPQQGYHQAQPPYAQPEQPPTQQQQPQPCPPPGAPPQQLYPTPPGAPVPQPSVQAFPPQGAQGLGVVRTNPHAVARDSIRYAYERNTTARQDVERLMEKPLTGKTVVDIFGTRGDEGLKEIAALYGPNFKETVTGQFKGNLQKVLLGLLTPAAEWDAVNLRDAMKGWGTHDTILIEVLTGRTSAHIGEVKQQYQRLFNRGLEQDIASETSGDYKNTLLRLLNGNRDTALFIDDTSAEQCANRLYNAGENKFGTDEGSFIDIFTKYNYRQLYQINQAYIKNFKKSLQLVLENETSGDFKRVLSACLDPGKFLANAIKDSIAGIGTKDHRLIQLVVNARRTDPHRLLLAKEAYVPTFKASMTKEVEQDLSGDYGAIVSRLLCVTDMDLVCVVLRDGMKGFGTNEKLLIDIIAAVPTREELSLLDNLYKRDFFKTLMEKFDEELSGNFKVVMKSIVDPLLDVHSVIDAISGVGTKETVLIDIFSSRPNYTIKQISAEYERIKKTPLRKDIEGDTAGNFERILINLCMGCRREGMKLTESEANDLADRIYKAGEGRWGTNDDFFVSTFTTYSTEELRYVEQIYIGKHKSDFENVIKGETSGSYEKALLACYDPVKFAAHSLLRTMKGIGTNDKELIRLVTSRSKKELQEVTRAFEAIAGGKTLTQWVESETSGDYRKALLSYIS